jgi:hypothetical protein
MGTLLKWPVRLAWLFNMVMMAVGLYLNRPAVTATFGVLSLQMMFLGFVIEVYGPSKDEELSLVREVTRAWRNYIMRGKTPGTDSQDVLGR